MEYCFFALLYFCVFAKISSYIVVPLFVLEGYVYKNLPLFFFFFTVFILPKGWEIAVFRKGLDKTSGACHHDFYSKEVKLGVVIARDMKISIVPLTS